MNMDAVIYRITEVGRRKDRLASRIKHYTSNLEFMTEQERVTSMEQVKILQEEHDSLAKFEEQMMCDAIASR